MEEQITINKTTEINTKITIHTDQQDITQLDQNRMLPDLQQNIIGKEEQQEAQQGGGQGQFVQLAQTLLNDASRSSDSFEMKAVKREVRRLLQMQQASQEELLVQYRWMETVLKDKYLKPRHSESSSYRARHGKVEAILMLIAAEKKKIQKSKDLKQAEVVKIEHRNMTTLSEEICRDNKDAANKREALNALLAKDVPMQKRKFSAEKEEIVKAYDALIGSFQKIVKSFCMTEKAKQNRLNAERVLLQLEREKKLYRKATYEQFAGNHFRTWNEDLIIVEEKPVRQISRAQLTAQKNVFVKADEEGRKADAATQMFFRLVGASKLCAKTEKARLDDGEQGQKEGLVIKKGEHLYTHEEAIEYSKATKKNLSYSIEALRQLATIQIIDMICGQKNRRPDSFLYKLKEQEIDEETYLMIEGVQVTNNTFSFGEDSFDSLNKNREEGEEVCTKQVVANRGDISVAFYDERVADTILSLDQTLIRTYFAAAGIEEKKADALVERLDKVQQALRNDKETGLRGQAAKATSQAELEKAVEDSYWGNESFVGYQGLLRDRTTKKDGALANINDLSQNEQLHSNALSMKKTANVKEKLELDLRDKFGYEKLGEETKKILNLIKKYTNASQNCERHQAFWGMPLGKFVKQFSPPVYRSVKTAVEQDATIPENQREAKIETRLRANYANRDEMINRAEEEPLEELRPKLETRIDALASREGALSEQEQKELTKLREYQTELFGQCDGTLEIPANAGVKYVSDRRGFAENIQWKQKNDTPLFCHEPRISDLNQGQVGDCYFIGTLAAVVNREPNLIKENMKDNRDGTVTVRFFKPALFGDPKPIYVKVDKSIAGNEESYKNGVNGAMWGKLYEKAFVASGLKKNRWFTRYTPKDIEMGLPEDASIYITGRKADTLFFVNSHKSYEKHRNPDSRAARRFKEHVNKVAAKLRSATKEEKIMIGGTFREFQTEGEKTERGERKFRGITSQHTYTILGLVKKEGKDFVQLRNTGGKDSVDLIQNETTGNYTYREATFRPGVFYLDIETFCRFFNQVYAVKKPAPAA